MNENGPESNRGKKHTLKWCPRLKKWVRYRTQKNEHKFGSPCRGSHTVKP